MFEALKTLNPSPAVVPMRPGICGGREFTVKRGGYTSPTLRLEILLVHPLSSQPSPPPYLRVPVQLLEVLLPRMQEQQLCRQVLWCQCIACRGQRLLLFGVALEGQIPHLRRSKGGRGGHAIHQIGRAGGPVASSTDLYRSGGQMAWWGGSMHLSSAAPLSLLTDY